MSPDLDRLIRLQDLDTAIEDARRRIAAHPQRLADADTRLDEAKQRVEAAREQLKQTQDARRALEKEAAVFQGRLTKFKDQLSEVKTNREYQAIQHEIATAQGELGAVEERVLEQMIAYDGIAADLKTAEGILVSRQREVNAEKAALEQERESVEKTLTEALATRTALIAETAPRLVALFEHVARARKGIALSAATREGLCSVCHVRLRPHVFQQIRQNDQIIQCESCQRIMYYVPPPAAAEAPVTHSP